MLGEHTTPVLPLIKGVHDDNLANCLLSTAREYFIIVSFWQAETSSCFAKKASTIQYGYRKWETHARVFCHTLEHGNSKDEIR